MEQSMDREPQPEPGVQPAEPRPEQQPEIKLPPMTPAKSTPGCSSRWVTIGCLAVLGLMVVALVAGVISFDVGFLALVKRAQQQIWGNLPADLDQQQRARTLNNLKAIGYKLKDEEDSYLIGEFLGRAGTALEDRTLTAEEVEELNLYMESVITGAAPPEQSQSPAEQEGP
jgi:hypothetical protein